MLIIGGKTDRIEVHIDEIFREYKFVLIDFACEFVGCQEVAEDIVQEFFLGMLNKDLCFPSVLALRSYMFTSIRNRSLDYMKHLEVKNKYVQIALNGYNPEYSEWEKTLDDELMDMLFSEIDRLPKRCREIFLLYLDGLSNEEIAERCQVSIETVKTQKKRAKKILKENLEKKKITNSFYLLLFLRIMYPF